MNIRIPHSWLLDYIKTKAGPKDIAKALSLHAFSVENLEQWADGDTIYEVEITPNRGDALSVVGIAREVHASLPQLKLKSQWIGKSDSRPISSVEKEAQTCSHPLPLTVKITNKDLVPQFSALILDNVSIQQSPKEIRLRLEKVGIRTLNNVVDVTNYFMIDKGQPMHSFDYDKIMESKMIVRESEAGESIITLDGVERKLPKGVIIIEDGKGRLIDLCGIMGAQNSEIDNHTKRVLLFVQIYDPVRIRHASMTLGHRTDAAVRFEKGIDAAGVLPSLWKAVAMIKENAGAKVASKLINIVNAPYKQKTIPLDIKKICKVGGVPLKEKEIVNHLSDLGFQIKGPGAKGREPEAVIPSWRHDDIETTEDLAEEVIRLYGYYNLPNTPLTGQIPPRRTKRIFYWEKKVREYLKYQGFFESYNTSATTRELAGSRAIKLSNPLSEEFAYLRTSLVPQLTEVIEKNSGYSNNIKVFELAAVYLPNNGKLPHQPMKLALAARGVEYPKLKGIVEGLLKELGLEEKTADIFQETPLVRDGDTINVELDFENIAKIASNQKAFIPISKYAPIKQDLTLVLPQNISYYQVEKTIKNTDKRIKRIKYQGTFKNTVTIAVELLEDTKQINASSASKIRQKILASLQKNLKVTLKK